MKTVSKEEFNALIDRGIIRHSGHVYVDIKKERDKRPCCVGVYRTKGAARKTYIEDYYADLAKRLCNNAVKGGVRRG